MARIMRMTRKRLGQLLIDEGLLDEDRLQEALGEQKKTGLPLGETLVQLGYVTELDIARAIVQQLGCPYLSLKQYYITGDVLALFPAEVARKHQFMPLDSFGKVVAIAIGGPVSQEVLEELEKLCGRAVHFYVTTQSEVREALEEHYGEKAGKKAAAAGKPASAPAVKAAPAKAAAPKAPAPAKAAAPAATAKAAPKAPAPAKAAPPAAAKAAKPGAPAAGTQLSSLGNLLLGDGQ